MVPFVFRVVAEVDADEAEEKAEVEVEKIKSYINPG
jgi:hypothetical protein